MDVERGHNEYKDYDEEEHHALLPNSGSNPPQYTDPGQYTERSRSFWATSNFNILHLSIAFVAGTLACFIGQYLLCGTSCITYEGLSSNIDSVQPFLAEPHAGSTEVHNFPPSSPTNAYPSLFPTNVGYPGETPTGAEPAVIATAPYQPLHTGAAVLVSPSSLGQKSNSSFNIFQKWGNLSPWYSVDRNTFGLDSGPEVPETCQVTGLHFLHRHGARYPTAWASFGGPANFSGRLNKVAHKWQGKGDLEFMNEWTYKLGEEVLTPFGRQQLYDLGISLRLKYGFLLKNFTQTKTIPTFRTESQDRMLNSALNFAIGFFGYPFEGQYQQSITIEADGFNNTLAPYKTCPNAADRSKSDRGIYYIRKWTSIYLDDALNRLQPQLEGYTLTHEDIYVLQQMCAYETVALGYSKFCGLFTEDEWEGFNYALDLSFWYGSAFGSPVAHIQGAGYVQELLARLTHTPIDHHRFSTNSTLNDNPITFPLDQSLYVDATHEVVVLNIITALNLTSLAASGPLPADHIPKDRSFKVSELAPFATNMQFQLLECTSTPGPQIRIIINDGVVPLTGIKGCPEQKDGMCSVEKFVQAQQELLDGVSWEYDCHGDWTLPEGEEWETVTGDSPKF